MNERDYQSQLLNGILGNTANEEPSSLGLGIYQNNWRENAHRALAVSFPTVQKLLGEDNFRQLCLLVNEYIPKEEYDWGEWAIPDGFVRCVEQFLSLHNATSLSYVVDVAKLDECIFLSQRAADPVVDHSSFATLNDDNAQHAVLKVAESCKSMTSVFPVDALYHFANGSGVSTEEIKQQLAAVADNNAPPSRYVHVSRTQFKPIIEAVTEADNLLLQHASKGDSVADIFTTAETLNHDFTSWLGNAIANAKVIGVEIRKNHVNPI